MIIGPGTSLTATFNNVASGSLYFNGSSAYLTYPNFSLATNDFTIECWSYLYAHTTTYPCIFSNYNSYTTGSLSLFAGHTTASTTQYCVAVNGSAFPSTAIISTTPIIYNTWVHLAVVRNSGVITLYVNGIANGTYSISTTLTGAGSLFYVGATGDGISTSYLNGVISNFRIVNGTAVYTSNFTPPTRPLTAITNTALLLNAYIPDLNVSADQYFSNVSLLLNGEGTSGSTTFTDLSNIKNSLTNTGSVSVDNSVVKYGSGAMKFSGTTSYLSVPANNALSFGTGDFTIELWFYSTSFAAQRALLASQGYFLSGTTGSWTFRVTSATSIAFAAYNAKTLISATYEFAVSTMTVNTWYHVAVVRTNGTIKIYLNGTASATSTTIAGALSDGSASGLWVGHNANDSDWIGNIDDLRITNGYARYTANFNVPTALTTGYLNGSAFTDSSVNNYMASTIGVSWKSQPVPPTLTYGSLYFNGASTSYLTIPDSTPLTLSGSAFTIECWVNPTSYSSNPAILVDKRQLLSPWSGSYALYLQTTNGYLSFWNGTSAYGSTTAPIANQWNHVAASYDGTNISLYLNGVRVLGPTATTIPNVVGATTNIGSDNNASGTPQQPFYGSLSNIRIVKGTALYSGTSYIIPNFPLTAIANTSLLLNTNPGSSYIDSSPNNATVTNAGAVVPSYNSPAITASYLGSFYSNGTRCLTNPSNANTALQSNNFTIECWVNFTNYNANAFGVIYLNYPAAFGANCIFFGKDTANSGYIAVWFGNYSTSAAVMAETSYPPAGWNHYALVRNGSTFTLYRNGVQSVTGTFAGAVTGTTNVDYISSNGSNGIAGLFTNFRIVNGTAVYTSNFTPPTRPLTAITNTALLLNATSSQTLLVDSSKNNATITNTGGVAFSPNTPLSSSPPPYAGSLYFNGTTNTSYLSIPDSTPLTLSGGAFTIEGWVNPKGYYPAANYNTLIAKRQIISPWSGCYGLYLTLTNGYFSFWNGTTTYSSTTTPIANQWNHFAAVYDGTNLSLFLNGIRVLVPTAISITNVVGAPITIGYDAYSGGTEPFYGSLASIRIVKGTALYNGPSYNIPIFPLTATTGTSTSLLLNATSSTTYLTDSSPYNATVINVGSVVWSQNSPVPVINPYSITSTFNNKASLYIGANSYVSYPDNVQLDPTGMFTIEFWWRPDAAGGTQEVITKGLGLQIYINTTLGMYAGLSASNNTTYFMNNGGGTFVAGNWNHVALVRNSSGVNTLYVNGTQVGTPTSGLMNTGSSPFYIGCLSGTQYFSPGYYSNIRFVNGTAVYTSNFVPPTTPLTAIPGTALLTAQFTNGTADNSGNNFTPTSVGTVTVSTSVLPF